MSGTETALLTSVPIESTTERRTTGHTASHDGPPATRPWYEIPEIVENIVSYLVKDPELENISLAEMRNIARVELVNKTFHCRCWRVIKQLTFIFDKDGKITHPRWSPCPDFFPILKKFRNLRKLAFWSLEVGGENTNNFLRGILKLQHEDMWNIQNLGFSCAATVSPVVPRMIELCSTSLTYLQLDWEMVRDGNLSLSLELNDNGNADIHPAVGPIARAVGLCRNLKQFQSLESPNGIGLVFRELSDKAKLEEIDLEVWRHARLTGGDYHDVPAEMPELVKCLSALQSVGRWSTNSITLYLATLRELTVFLDAGNSKRIEWDSITHLGIPRITTEDHNWDQGGIYIRHQDQERGWIGFPKKNFEELFRKFPKLESCFFRVMVFQNRDCSGLVGGFLETYWDAIGKRRLTVAMEHVGKHKRVVGELGRLIVQVKNTTGVSGNLEMNTPYLEEAGPLDPASLFDFDIVCYLSVKFTLGSAECTVRVPSE